MGQEAQRGSAALHVGAPPRPCGCPRTKVSSSSRMLHWGGSDPCRLLLPRSLRAWAKQALDNCQNMRVGSALPSVPHTVLQQKTWWYGGRPTWTGAPGGQGPAPGGFRSGPQRAARGRSQSPAHHTILPTMCMRPNQLSMTEGRYGRLSCLPGWRRRPEGRRRDLRAARRGVKSRPAPA